MPRLILRALFALVVLSFAGGTIRAEPLTVGVAVTDITPPPAYRISGYFRERLSTGTHDPLRAKAFVLQQRDETAALVFCDVIGVSHDVSRRARKQASAQTGIPVSNILIAATHSHTGPQYFGALRKYFHDQAVAKHGKDPHEEVDYPSQFVEKLANVIVEAKAAARPASLAAGTTEQTGLSFNRRFHMKGSKVVRFNPGKLNPKIVRPAGPIDPEVGLLAVRNPDGTQTHAVLTVFALHLDTVGGTEYAADYPFYLERTLQKQYGESIVSAFGNGTCGDINHVDVSHKRPQKGHGEAERIGTALGKTVSAAIPKLSPIARPSLAASSATVDAPMKPYTPSEVEAARGKMDKVATGKLPFLERVAAYNIMAIELRGGSTLPIEVQVFRLSDDVAIVGLTGEVFVDLGLAIKRASPFKTTLVVELCNDAPGYIPTKKAFAEGSYETVNARIAPGGGEMMLEAAERLLAALGG